MQINKGENRQEREEKGRTLSFLNNIILIQQRANVRVKRQSVAFSAGAASSALCICQVLLPLYHYF